jgi:hypothetical protein
MNAARSLLATRQFVTTLAVMAIAGLAFPPFALAASSAAVDGLVRVESSQLNEMRLRPGADLSAYRQVLIDPVDVAIHPEWLGDMNRARARRVTPGDAQHLASEAAASLSAIVGEAFQARGYGVVATPGPGVLRLSVRVSDLYVNAPEEIAGPGRRLYAREAGSATLLFEARDAATGELLLLAVDPGIARVIGGLTRATAVSNRFWFDALYRRWVKDCSNEISARGKTLASAPSPGSKQ